MRERYQWYLARRGRLGCIVRASTPHAAVQIATELIGSGCTVDEIAEGDVISLTAVAEGLR